MAKKLIAKPIARTDDLVIQELSDELLVYDLITSKAHALNKFGGPGLAEL
jgi:hypothetical protein